MSRIEAAADPLVRAGVRRLERRLRHAHARHGARLPARDGAARRPVSAAASTCAQYLHRGRVDAIAFSTAWSLGVFLAGVATMRTLPTLHRRRAEIDRAPSRTEHCMHPLIYDWNTTRRAAAARPCCSNDETLRDGLQSPSVRCPTIEQKLASCT